MSIFFSICTISTIERMSIRFYVMREKKEKKKTCSAGTVVSHEVTIFLVSWFKRFFKEWALYRNPVII